MTRTEGISILQNTFGINHIYAKMVFLSTDKNNLVESAKKIIDEKPKPRVNSKGGFNTPFGKYSNPLICDVENLRKISKALQKTKILHQGYEKVLEKAKKGDFVYFDPPYHPVNATSSFTSYTSEGFFAKEQKERNRK